jgi:3',5'-cyclic AMP phosphodiesterase CpdA
MSDQSTSSTIQCDSAKDGRALRIAHLTDIHVQPERGAAEGVIACLEDLHTQQDRPELILNGGDVIMDAVAAEEARVALQWDLWESIIRDHCEIPQEYCLGNHDIWGWNKKRSGCTGSEPLFGKKYALERMGLTLPYRSFDRAGWRFIVLDSSFEAEGGAFTARLDATQWEWLRAELAATPPETPVLVLSHVPILAGGSVFFSGNPGETERSGNWVVPSAWMHIDSRALVSLFAQYPNVRLCLSGHTHLHDRVEYNGVTYLCDGAVSGQWWRGDYHQTPAGYGIIDLYQDGRFQHRYRPLKADPI